MDTLFKIVQTEAEDLFQGEVLNLSPVAKLEYYNCLACLHLVLMKSMCMRTDSTVHCMCKARYVQRRLHMFMIKFAVTLKLRKDQQLEPRNTYM